MADIASPQGTPDDRDLISRAEAVQRFKVTFDTLSRWVRVGYKHFGGHRFERIMIRQVDGKISESDLVRILNLKKESKRKLAEQEAEEREFRTNHHLDRITDIEAQRVYDEERIQAALTEARVISEETILSGDTVIVQKRIAIDAGKLWR